MTVPIEHVLGLAALLFAMGLAGLLVRRNLLFMLLSIEVMLNASGLAFIAAGARWAEPDGQSMFLLILAMAAAEVAVGLALILRIHRHEPSLDADAIASWNQSSPLGEGDEEVPP
ncbi:MAG: NADH-quinone oxidoreductase subunit NuoK [Myxococcota bacterium]